MFVLIWRYDVRPENRDAFSKVYGREGVWARLFAKGAGYIRTELFEDPEDTAEFLTLDFWNSQNDFAEFHRKHESSYQDIDAMCEALAETETFVGAFEMTGSSDAREFYPLAADD